MSTWCSKHVEARNELIVKQILFIHVVWKKNWNFLAGAKITDLCIFCDILAIFKAWNICLALSSPFLAQYMFYCHTFLWIHGRSPLHVPYLALLPPDGTCVALVLSPPCFPLLSSLRFILLPVIDLDPECRITVTKLVWHSEDPASWYILIIKANEMHYFSHLFW